MEKVLTVVIPSFNVEKYLRQTLESLRNEEILEDVEVLIVDDEIMIRRGLSKIIQQTAQQRLEKNMRNVIRRPIG